MKAAYLIKYGEASTAFQIREVVKPQPGADQVLIKVEGFGLNFADVMARLGLYKGAPPLPALLGYEVVGSVELLGSNVQDLAIGDRVVALTRFGGYAQYAVAEKAVVFRIPNELSVGVAAALATQYSTAYFLARDLANLQKGDRVLIHAAAGGVGTALVQLAKHTGCTVFGTCSSQSKMRYLEKNGVDFPINYLEHDFADAFRQLSPDTGLDVIFDPVGGKSVKRGFGLLNAGGRIFCFGVSSMNQAKSILGKLRVLAQFGIYHPIQFLSQAKGMIGVNMLKIADDQPEKVSRAMQKVIAMTQEGILNPFVGGQYDINQLSEAHKFLESRKSMGKIVVKW